MQVLLRHWQWEGDQLAQLRCLGRSDGCFACVFPCGPRCWTPWCQFAEHAICGRVSSDSVAGWAIVQSMAKQIWMIN